MAQAAAAAVAWLEDAEGDAGRRAESVVIALYFLSVVGGITMLVLLTFVVEWIVRECRVEK